MKIEPILRSAQVLKQEAEEIGYQGKDVAEYVTKHQALDREGRAAWRDTQNMQAHAGRRRVGKDTSRHRSENKSR